MAMKKRILIWIPVVLVLLGLSPGLARAAEVVLYSSNPPELLDLVSQDFQKKTGIKVSTVRLGTGEAMKRIAAEKEKPLCDLFWSGDVAVLDNAKQYFMSYRSPEAKALPKNYIEKDARWTSSNAHVMIIMYNKKLVRDQDRPKSWKDLLSPRWKGKVVIANPEKSGSAYAQVYGIYKLYGWDGLQKLINNAKILDSSSLIYKGVANGEYPVGITMEYAAYRYVAGGSKDVGIVYASDGSMVAPEGAALVANGPHPQEAKKFFDYLVSRPVEEMIYAQFYRRPARTDTRDIAGLPSLKKIVVMKRFDPLEANALEKEILKRWKEMVLSR
jgi:iron(III) transport system substrate-binding protein